MLGNIITGALVALLAVCALACGDGESSTTSAVRETPEPGSELYGCEYDWKKDIEAEVAAYADRYIADDFQQWEIPGDRLLFCIGLGDSALRWLVTEEYDLYSCEPVPDTRRARADVVRCDDVR